MLEHFHNQTLERQIPQSLLPAPALTFSSALIVQLQKPGQSHSSGMAPGENCREKLRNLLCLMPSKVITTKMHCKSSLGLRISTNSRIPGQPFPTSVQGFQTYHGFISTWIELGEIQALKQQPGQANPSFLPIEHPQLCQPCRNSRTSILPGLPEPSMFP